MCEREKRDRVAESATQSGRGTGGASEGGAEKKRDTERKSCGSSKQPAHMLKNNSACMDLCMDVYG